MAGELTAIIPARGGSKRIPKKNLALLCGKPLIQYTIDAALQSQWTRRVVVSTDDPEIGRLSSDLGVDLVLMRPAELATDVTPMADVVAHAAQELSTLGVPLELMVLLQPTSPFRQGFHVDEAVDLFLRVVADTVTGVRVVDDHPYYMWRRDGEQVQPLYSYAHQQAPRTSLPEYLIENGSLYILRHSAFVKHGLYGPRTVPYLMDALSSVDIDEPIDLEWAEFLMARQRLQQAHRGQ